MFVLEMTEMISLLCFLHWPLEILTQHEPHVLQDFLKQKWIFICFY